MKNSDIR